MKQFAEYLVDHGIVEAEPMVKLYLDWLSAAPSLAEQALRHGWMPARAVLAVLSRMGSKGVDFKTACRDLGLWDQKTELAIRTGDAPAAIPICKLLVERGSLGPTELSQALEGYRAEVENTPATSPVGEPTATAIPLTRHYALFFNEALRANLARIFGLLAIKETAERTGAAAVVRQSALRDGHEILGALRGAARLCGASEPEAICERLEKAFGTALGAPEGSDTSFAELGKCGLEALERLTAILGDSS